MYFTEKEKEEIRQAESRRLWKEKPIESLFWSIVALAMIVWFIIYGPWLP